MPEEAKWYIVHTYSGYENKVASNLEKNVEKGIIAQMGLSQNGRAVLRKPRFDFCFTRQTKYKSRM